MRDLSYLTHNDPLRFQLGTDKPTMKAVVTTGNGGYDKLDYCEVPVPTPQANEMLIRVLAAGINNTEINTRLGWYSSKVMGGTEQTAKADSDETVDDGGWNEKTPFPLIQGTDCCGEIVALGESVNHKALGSRVLVRACMRTTDYSSLDNIWMASDFDGAFAEYVTVPASEVFVVNCTWSDAELATIPCAYGTAENMVHRAKIDAYDRVLVTGASGGVGSATVQLAKRRGAHVTAIASASKMAALQELGADQVIPRGTDMIELLGESNIDVVIDNVAGEGFESLIKILSRGGRYTSSGAIAGPIVQMDMRDFYLKDITLIGCTAWDEPVFPALINYIEHNEIKPLLAKTFPLRNIIEAQEEFMQKKHVGNFVLLPAND